LNFLFALGEYQGVIGQLLFLFAVFDKIVGENARSTGYNTFYIDHHFFLLVHIAKQL
jgi:hypothetical protein